MMNSSKKPKDNTATILAQAERALSKYSIDGLEKILESGTLANIAKAMNIKPNKRSKSSSRSGQTGVNERKPSEVAGDFLSLDTSCEPKPRAKGVAEQTNSSSLRSIYPFGFDRPEDSPGFSLWQTTILWQRKIKRALEDYDISHAGFVIIATLYWFKTKSCETSQIMITKWTKLDKMTVSKTIRILSAKNLLRKEQDAFDTRANLISLTDEGRELVRTLVPIVEKIDEDFFGQLWPYEQESFISSLNKLVDKNSEN